MVQGIYNNSPEDRHFESVLNDHLEEIDDEFDDIEEEDGDAAHDRYDYEQSRGEREWGYL
jgi:hypothetical protein